MTATKHTTVNSAYIGKSDSLAALGGLKVVREANIWLQTTGILHRTLRLLFSALI
jgi:hypothetical protein